MESVQRELEPVKQEQQSEQPKEESFQPVSQFSSVSSMCWRWIYLSHRLF